MFFEMFLTATKRSSRLHRRMQLAPTLAVHVCPHCFLSAPYAYFLLPLLLLLLLSYTLAAPRSPAGDPTTTSTTTHPHLTPPLPRLARAGGPSNTTTLTMIRVCSNVCCVRAVLTPLWLAAEQRLELVLTHRPQNQIVGWLMCVAADPELLLNCTAPCVQVVGGSLLRMASRPTLLAQLRHAGETVVSLVHMHSCRSGGAGLGSKSWPQTDAYMKAVENRDVTVA